MEFWTATVAAPGRSLAFAQEAEARGWDGMLVVDSQNLSGDPYVCLALAATATERLGLETSVTNPVTRHAAVTASSELSVQRLSKGRMVLGIGRGDSALAHLGRAPARLGWFERYLATLQAYLRGEELDGAATHVIRLVPRRRSAYREARVWIDEGTWFIRRTEIEEENGNLREVQLAGFDPNPRLGTDAFLFTPPRGVQVITR